MSEKRKTARVLWVCDARGEKDKNKKKKSDDDVLLFFLSLKSVCVCVRARVCVCVCDFLFSKISKRSSFLSFSSLSLSSLVLNSDLAFALTNKKRARPGELGRFWKRDVQVRNRALLFMTSSER